MGIEDNKESSKVIDIVDRERLNARRNKLLEEYRRLIVNRDGATAGIGIEKWEKGLSANEMTSKGLLKEIKILKEAIERLEKNKK